MAENIPDDIFEGITNAFCSDEETASRVFMFLCNRLSTKNASPFIGTLRRVLNKPKLFIQMAKRMTEQTETAENVQKDPEKEPPQKIPDDILNGIMNGFGSDNTTISRIFFFLCNHACNNTATPFIGTLEKALNKPMLFVQVAKRMVEDTETIENEQKYQKMMSQLREAFLKSSVVKRTDGGQKWELVLQPKGALSAASSCFIKAMEHLPFGNAQSLFDTISTMAGPIALNTGQSIAMATVVKVVQKTAIVTVFLAYDVICNITRWWNGKITGKRCVKNILDCGVGMAAGVTGGIGGEMVGAIAGSSFGPIGTVLGAIVGTLAGGALASITADTLCRRLTQWVFGIPQSEALENAYVFLGLSPKASNDAVNSKFRHLALMYHPDKGGDIDNWTQLQYSVQVIKLARGD